MCAYGSLPAAEPAREVFFFGDAVHAEPHESLGLGIDIRSLTAFFELLTPRQRQVLRLRYIDGLKISVVASVMDVSSKRVRQIERRALERLHTWFTRPWLVGEALRIKPTMQGPAIADPAAAAEKTREHHRPEIFVPIAQLLGISERKTVEELAWECIAVARVAQDPFAAAGEFLGRLPRDQLSGVVGVLGQLDQAGRNANWAAERATP